MQIELETPGLAVVGAELRNGVVYIRLASTATAALSVDFVPVGLRYSAASGSGGATSARARAALIDDEGLDNRLIPALFVDSKSLAQTELQSRAPIAIRNIRHKSSAGHGSTIYAQAVDHLGSRELRVLATLGCDALIPHLVWSDSFGFALNREPGSDPGRAGDWQSLWCLATYLTLRKCVRDKSTAREWLAYSPQAHWLHGAHDYSKVDPSKVPPAERIAILANLSAGRPYLHSSIQTEGFGDPAHPARKVLDELMADSESLLLGEGASASLVRITSAVLSGAAPETDDVNAVWNTITLADWLALWLTATPMWRGLDTDAARVAGRVWLMQFCDNLWTHMTQDGGRFDTRAPHMAGAHTAACLWREARWRAAEQQIPGCAFVSTQAMPWLMPADDAGMIEGHRL